MFKTLDKTVKTYPGAHPLFHSDNGPMEGFWGIFKRERYYGHRFAGKQELTQMIHNYIHYYSTGWVQRDLGGLAPMEKHSLYLAA